MEHGQLIISSRFRSLFCKYLQLYEIHLYASSSNLSLLKEVSEHDDGGISEWLDVSSERSFEQAAAAPAHTATSWDASANTLWPDSGRLMFSL